MSGRVACAGSWSLGLWDRIGGGGMGLRRFWDGRVVCAGGMWG